MRDMSIIGIRPCGCVTFWLSAEDGLGHDDLDAMRRVLETDRRLEVVDRQWSTDQLVTECPHEKTEAA